MKNVIPLKRKTDAQLLIDGCREDLKTRKKFTDEHLHTMWLLKEIMLNEANSEHDRLAAAHLAYTSSSVRNTVRFMLDMRKGHCDISNKCIECQKEYHELMTQLCEATG
jgi:hypothetical protein